MRSIRTTLTIDDDLLATAQHLAEERSVPLDTIVSELVRTGLSHVPPPSA